MIETTAVLDRFEGDRAVLVLDDHRREVVCDPDRLAAAGREQDAVFAVRVDGDALVEATYLPDETATRRDRAQRRFDRLSERLGGEGSERTASGTDDATSGDRSADGESGDGSNDDGSGDEDSTSRDSTDDSVGGSMGGSARDSTGDSTGDSADDEATDDG